MFNNLTLGGPEPIYHSHECGELCMYFCIYIIMCVYCVDSVLVCVWLHWWINVLGELSKPNTWGWHLACSTLKTVSIGNNILIPGHHKIGNLSSCSCMAWMSKILSYILFMGVLFCEIILIWFSFNCRDTKLFIFKNWIHEVIIRWFVLHFGSVGG